MYSLILKKQMQTMQINVKKEQGTEKIEKNRKKKKKEEKRKKRKKRKKIF